MDIARFLKGEVFSKEALKYLTELLIAFYGAEWDREWVGRSREFSRVLVLLYSVFFNFSVIL